MRAARFNFGKPDLMETPLYLEDPYLISVVLQKLFVKNIFIKILFTLKLLVAL